MQPIQYETGTSIHIHIKKYFSPLCFNRFMKEIMKGPEKRLLSNCRKMITADTIQNGFIGKKQNNDDIREAYKKVITNEWMK